MGVGIIINLLFLEMFDVSLT